MFAVTTAKSLNDMLPEDLDEGPQETAAAVVEGAILGSLQVAISLGATPMDIVWMLRRSADHIEQEHAAAVRDQLTGTLDDEPDPIRDNAEAMAALERIDAELQQEIDKAERDR